MRTVTTYAGRTLEFLDLEARVVHLKPRQTLELEESELEEVKEKYPEIFGKLVVHGFTPNQKSKMGLTKKTKKDTPSSKKPGRPPKSETKDKPKEKSDPSKS